MCRSFTSRKMQPALEKQTFGCVFVKGDKIVTVSAISSLFSLLSSLCGRSAPCSAFCVANILLECTLKVKAPLRCHFCPLAANSASANALSSLFVLGIFSTAGIPKLMTKLLSLTTHTHTNLCTGMFTHKASLTQLRASRCDSGGYAYPTKSRSATRCGTGK